MSDLGTNLHPLAQAVLRYYVAEGASQTQLAPPAFLEQLFELADRLPARKFVAAADDLLAVSRFLQAEGRLEAAEAVSEHLRTSAHRATVRAVGAGGLSTGVERAGERYDRFVDREEDAALSPAPARDRAGTGAALGPSLKDKWSTMSQARRDKLAGLADQILGSGPDKPDEG